ncbi:MAG: recombinase family protein [Clostridia bacterium]|nr:recombinase family protein [Clostridia bacterium]
MRIWKTSLYLRLSKDDGEKGQSESITNQKSIIENYLKGREEFDIISVRIDDGYTGSNFNRPAFNAMMSDVKERKIDCIIVKDLSRFGREHIEASKYIEKIFPFIGVRFISLNDNYDSENLKSSDNIIIPFKNLINDSLCRDISVKTRSSLKAKRNNGDFVGAYTCYGYAKDKTNHNKILIDEDVADIVRDIFRYKINGMSSEKIAEKLNDLGVLSPMEYKLSKGYRYSTGFKTNHKAKWSAKAIMRILQNPIYIGDLIQGKLTTPTHKVKKIVKKAQEEWDIVQDNHQAIISKDVFEVVQKIMKLDTKCIKNENYVHLFSGLLICAKCGESMTRKIVPDKHKKKIYVYYICSNYKYGKKCMSHSISEKKLEKCVTDFVREHIKKTLDISHFLSNLECIPLKQIQVKKINKQINQKKSEIERFFNIKKSLHESYKLNLLKKDDYQMMYDSYSSTVDELNYQLIKLQDEVESIISNKKNQPTWIDRFKQFDNIKELNRGIIVFLINQIKIHDKKNIEIQFHFQSEFEMALELMKNTSEMEVAL